VRVPRGVVVQPPAVSAARRRQADARGRTALAYESPRVSRHGRVSAASMVARPQPAAPSGLVKAKSSRRATNIVGNYNDRSSARGLLLDKTDLSSAHTSTRQPLVSDAAAAAAARLLDAPQSREIQLKTRSTVSRASEQKADRPN